MADRPTPPGEPSPDAPAEAPSRARGLPLWTPLVAAVLAVGFALAVAAVTCGPLLTIVNPPMPPVYPGATLLNAEHIDYGVDKWQYRTDDDACQVYALFAEAALRCAPLPPGFCAAPRTPPPDANSLYVGQCRGRGEAWPFYWVWEVVMREVFTDDSTHTEFDLSRTVYWGTGE